MKKLMLLIFLSTLSISAQYKIDSITGEGSYTRIVEVENSKKTLHKNALEWIAINFKDANEVIKLNIDDKIISKGYFEINYESSGYPVSSDIYFMMELSFKENMYRLKMNSIKLSVMGIELPFETYYKVRSYKDYLEEIEILYKESTEFFTKNYYKKRLNNPEKFKKEYDSSIELNLLIRSKVDEELLSMDQSIEKALRKQDDGW